MLNFQLSLLLLATSLSAVEIEVKPHLTRAIEGISEIDRDRYFSVANNGTSLETSLRSDDRFNYLTRELGARLGRNLGPIHRVARSRRLVREDPNRPGFVDLAHLKKRLTNRRQGSEAKLKAAFGESLDIAAHGQHNAFPKFLGTHFTEDSKKHPKHPEYVPKNIAGAAELSATVLRHSFSDLTRPTYYEPLNEPHWSFFNDQHFADWHLATKARVQQDCPQVQVGGLCMSVAYFYQNFYRSWNGMKSFMDNTRGELDFYSFHAYDYYNEVEAGKNTTQITSGLPLEGMLDLINNYSHNTFKKGVKIVISEHGGYAAAPSIEGVKFQYDGEHLAKDILANAPENLRKEGHPGELQRRATIQWLHVSSILANTLAFIDHPHAVQKAVPFILTNTENWDPKYYASLYTPKDYRRGGELQPNFLISYYQLMQGIAGRRIIADSPDPDLQTRAFVDENRVFTVVNNLSTAAHPLTLTGLSGAKHQIRRLTRGPHLIPTYTSGSIDKLSDLTIASRECIVLISTFSEKVKESTLTNERVFYGDGITRSTSETNKVLPFTIKVESPEKASQPMLRITLDRGAGADYRLAVTFNGTPLKVPLEDAAPRYDHSTKGYATTKFIPVPKALLQETNQLQISFPDGKKGAIGAAVLRARYQP